MSFLAIEGLHAFVTGAAGGIGQAIVQELLSQGCRVTAHDRRASPLAPHERLYTLQGDISDEASISSSIDAARAHFGAINILAANAGITDEGNEYPIWRMPTDIWDKVYAINVRGTYFTIKHFLRAAEEEQQTIGKELQNLAVVVTGSECGKFGQAGHTEYASGKAGLQYGLVRGVKNEIAHLNKLARINAVAPGWVNTPLIGDRLDDPREMWIEAQATVALRKIAQPTDVARAVAFLASHRAAGHISGECISVDGGMEGRLLWKEEEPTSIPPVISQKRKSTIKVAISVDFDAVSGWLGTGQSPDNSLADYSSGFFSAYVGVRRLLRLFKRLNVSDKITWFIPGHSMESFPEQTKAILASGCELGLHGYCHEGAAQLTESQEREVLEKCIQLAEGLTGKKPRGYRAPLYQLRENTIRLLEEHGFLYDSSLTHYDSTPYYVPRSQPITPPNYRQMSSAKQWMKPLPQPEQPTDRTLVELPANWYGEDMTPLQYWPHTPNSQGYVDARVVEKMWMDRFEWLQRERDDKAVEEGEEMTLFSLILHPDTSGMAHVIGMVERFLMWVRQKGDAEVEWCSCGEVAERWKGMQTGK
ncbi:NAD(P)-binding protein [Rhizodiscina lignyota]|uniref:NAD(P)-binding protein n=1 Tax=Rhizodiscina lignyota TaxID=1504668 RepID=A0A9P4IJW7_9PEZI|nr:NAD(P)-binding protein [Rhizodiscina lignyota]